MRKTQETRWVELSSSGDRAAGLRRFVKTMGPPDGRGRVMKLEIVAEAEASPPPEEVFTYAMYEWLDDSPATKI